MSATSSKSRFPSRRIAAYLFGAAVALLAITSPEAQAITIWTHDQGDGFTATDYYDDDGELLWTKYTDPDGNWYLLDYETGLWEFSDPNPAEDNGGGGLSEDELDKLLYGILKQGSTEREQEDTWKMLIIMGITPDNLGPPLIDPFDGGIYANNDYDGFGGYSLFDPNVPLGEQLPRTPSGDEDDDDDSNRDSDPAASDPSDYGEYYGLSPEFINPIPAFSQR